MKKTAIIIATCFAGLFYSLQAFAICPLCTIAVAAGVGLSRYLGIDDTITGLWIGGLTVSMILWTIDWFDRKNFKFIGRNFITAILYYLFIVFPLYFYDVLGHPLNVLWGVDKLFLGIAIGSVVFFIGAIWYFYIKKNNDGHAYFPFQKVVMPIAPLIILSIVFYFITK